MAQSGSQAGKNGLTVLVVDPDCARLHHLLRNRPPHAAMAASLHEAFPLAERLMPDLIAIAAEFLADPDVEGLVRLADMLGCRHIFYGAQEGDGDEELGEARPIVRLRRGDRIEQLIQRAGPGHGDGERAPERGRPDLILIGASTGGVAAVEAVLRAFPLDCPPTVVVQHIREGFVQNLVRRLDSFCRPQVIEAHHGHRLRRGTIYFASDAHRHLVVNRRTIPCCELEASPPRHGHRPAVDVLFESAVGWGATVSAAVLTGMGADGAAGLGLLRRAGAHTIAQDQETSVVWGMPRVAVETGAASEVLPLPQIGAALLRGGAARRHRLAGGAVQ